MTQKSPKKASLFKFVHWKFDNQKCLLKSANEETQLAKLQNDLLTLFVENPKTVLTRKFLIDQLWGSKIVNEEALSRLVAELRKQLSDSAKNPKFIKTLPKKGYEFIQEVEEVSLIGISSNKLHQYLLASLILLSIFLIYFFISPLMVAKEQHLLITQSLASAKRVTATPGMERQPVISNQGDKLAYTKIVNRRSVVIIENINDGEKTSIAPENFNLNSPVFSNDGLSMAMTAFDGNKCQVMTHDFETKKQKLLATCQVDNNSKTLGWSNDDAKIYYVNLENQYNTSAIWQIDRETSETKQVTFPESSDLFDSNPNISPDGQFLSFNRGNHSVQNIYLKKLLNDKIILTNLTKDQNYSLSHHWYDDETIIYDSDKTGNRKLWLININTGIHHLLGARGAQFPSLSKATNKLAFQVAEYEANIWLVDLETQQETRVIHSTKYDNNPAFNHKGNQFVFTSNREDHGIILAYDFETNKETKIFEIPETKLTRPIWSKDDSKLIASGNSTNGYWSFELDIKSAKYRKLSFDQENFAGFYFQNEIYALSKPSNGESYLIKLDSNEATIELPIKGISRVMPINTDHLLISKANKEGLFLINMNDYSIKAIIEDFPATFLNFWTAIDSDVYYVNKNNNYSLWKYNIETQTNIKATDFFPNSVGPTISVNLDKTKILITKTDRAESDVFIAELGK